ncbi:MAG TPA: hypothetical protein VM142_13070 [Acidimicrobiales bacterium]|nr:hypothetical protein [Acidimicrobiales bacterium]
MRASPDHRRSLSTAVCLLVLSTALSLGVIVPAPASAFVGLYSRTTRPFSGVDLRTRGYINQACLTADTECRGAFSGAFRAEATAQAKTIQELSRRRASVIGPSDKVHWEVAPNTGGCEPEVQTGTDGEVDPPDLPPGYTACNWRIDLVVDDGGLSPAILEVKRWQGDSTRDAVNAQLDNYVAQARTYDSRLNFGRSIELNGPTGWVKSYSGNGLNGP